MNVSNIVKICLLLAMFALAMESCQGNPSAPKSSLNLTDGQETVMWERLNEPVNKRGKRDEGASIRCRVMREAPASYHGVVKRSASQFVADKSRCLTHDRRRRQIMAGTHWCGNGDKADHYNDMGYFSNVDKCCRTHDHCEKYVVGDSTAYGVTNDTPYTWSDCACDDGFRDCLHEVDSYMSTFVGKMFFNVVTTSKCLEFDKNDPTKAKAVDKGTYAERIPESESESKWSWWSWWG